MTERSVYLMRGLPSTGKSFSARRLVSEGGIVLETDQYFYTHVGTDPEHYDYSEALLPLAREWLFDQFAAAIGSGVTPIVVDRGNGQNPESSRFARYAVDHGYDVQLREPESEWWQELRVLLKYREHLDSRVLDLWSQRLAERSRSTHRVPESTIRRWMNSWNSQLTVQDILKCTEE